MPGLTPHGLELLLARLNPDPGEAAERYELLRLKLMKCVSWKGCPESQADALADIVLDRVAAKLADGQQIDNVNAYACEVLRFVWLEHSRRRKEDTTATEDGLPEIAVQPDLDFLDAPDVRLNCLRKCMNEVVPESTDRQLIVGYYDAEGEKKNKDQRRDLAAQLGITTTTLKVKACRIRARLERCINDCVHIAVTKMPHTDTSI